jgi:uncharacterized protein GlcG (DUF336 family)
MGLLAFLSHRAERQRAASLRRRTVLSIEQLEDRSVPAVTQLSAAEVDLLLQRAAGATASTDGIIAVVDRNGRILGVRVEPGVSTAVTGDTATLVFAIDGAVAKARSAAFFANNQLPITSRTVRFISQSTVTEREVDANPNSSDPLVRGPGFVAPIGVGAHFPPGVAFTPEVDLFGIEHTNRDSIVHPGPDLIKGTADDIDFRTIGRERFDIDLSFVPAGQDIFAPESYGFASGLMPAAQARGIATLPGGIPIFRNGSVIGGIGVFFPGTTGYASAENSALSSTYNPALRDRSLEAEYDAFAAVGGSSAAGARIGTIDGIPALAGFDLPFGRVDLVGITLDLFGPRGSLGVRTLVNFGASLGAGSSAGTDEPLIDPGADGQIDVGDTTLVTTLPGLPAPDGWLVTPHAGAGFSAADVTTIINQGIATATRARAGIRLPLGSRTRMVFAVTDLTGEVLGLYRMPDATMFSIDVAVAKARNVAYYADPAALQTIDQVPGLPKGVAFTNRTFRFLALPRFPSGAQNVPPGPFSILNDGGVDPRTGRIVGPRLPYTAFTSVYGFDAFNPGSNFRNSRDPIQNQNGIVFFPGSAPIYKGGVLIGGFGVSGDGVDQDDVVTYGGARGFFVPATVKRADHVFFRGVRLPYQKFSRNPFA